MCDTERITEIRSQKNEWLESVDKSGLHGSNKALCNQHGILLRLAWPLFIYKVPLGKVEANDQQVPKKMAAYNYIVLVQNLTAVNVSGRKEYKVAKVRQAIRLRDSIDETVSAPEDSGR